MHPIERLRFVARAHGVDDSLLAIEATAALMSFAHQPPALVAGARRVLARQPACGPLWWSCARLLTADDVWATAQDVISELEDDQSSAALRYALGGCDDETPAVAYARAIGDAEVAVHVASDPPAIGGEQSWLVVPTGAQLSTQMWVALRENLAGSPEETSVEYRELSEFTHFVGTHGLLPIVALDEPDCPVAPELFRLAG